MVKVLGGLSSSVLALPYAEPAREPSFRLHCEPFASPSYVTRATVIDEQPPLPSLSYRAQASTLSTP